jgi:hypothetical protein
MTLINKAQSCITFSGLFLCVLLERDELLSLALKEDLEFNCFGSRLTFGINCNTNLTSVLCIRSGLEVQITSTSINTFIL